MIKQQWKQWRRESEPKDREWWRLEAKRTRSDWSTLLRQRISVLAWIKAGRPDKLK